MKEAFFHVAHPGVGEVARGVVLLEGCDSNPLLLAFAVAVTWCFLAVKECRCRVIIVVNDFDLTELGSVPLGLELGETDNDVDVAGGRGLSFVKAPINTTTDSKTLG